MQKNQHSHQILKPTTSEHGPINVRTKSFGGKAGFGIGSSSSVPNLPRSFRKATGAGRGTLTSTPPIKRYGAEVGTSNRPCLRSNSSPSIMRSLEFLREQRQPRQPVTVPSFGPHDGFSKGSHVPNSADMIIGALRAGEAHFQRGMHHGDIFEVVCSAYNFPNSASVHYTLNRTLEKLVACGVVSQSYGTKPEDATYRLVQVNPIVATENPKLVVDGKGIKAIPNARMKSGLCLPGSSSHLTRVARTNTTTLQTANTALQEAPTEGRLRSGLRVYSSPSDPALSRSFAERAGVKDHLKPDGYRPNSPESEKGEIEDNDSAHFGAGDAFRQIPLWYGKNGDENGNGSGRRNEMESTETVNSGPSNMLQRFRLQEYAKQLASIDSFGGIDEDDAERQGYLSFESMTLGIQRKCSSGSDDDDGFLRKKLHGYPPEMQMDEDEDADDDDDDDDIEVTGSFSAGFMRKSPDSEYPGRKIQNYEYGFQYEQNQTRIPKFGNILQVPRMQ